MVTSLTGSLFMLTDKPERYRTAFVTGASVGLGRAFAEMLLAVHVGNRPAVVADGVAVRVEQIQLRMGPPVHLGEALPLQFPPNCAADQSPVTGENRSKTLGRPSSMASR